MNKPPSKSMNPFAGKTEHAPQPPRVLHVCEDIACKCHGSDDLIATLEERFGPEGAVSADGRSTWHRSPCLGQCDRAPAVLMMEAGLEIGRAHV